MNDKTDILDFDKKYGFVQIPNILVMNMSKLNLSGGELALLTIIRMFAYQKDCSFPSLKTLQNISGFSRQGIINIIKLLEKKGYLVITRKLNSNNLYSFKPLNLLLEKMIQNMGGSQNFRPEVVKNFDPKNKDINNNNKNTHSSNSSYITTARAVPKTKSVCENEIEKIKSTKTFQNSDMGLIENIVKKKGKEAVIAAEYLDKAFSNQAVRNPAGLLISTLRNGLYCDLPASSGINGIKADIERLNERYKGFAVFKGESIKEILNIGGQIAFHTDNCLREIVLTTAKSYEEFENYLNKREAVNNTS